MVKKTHEQFVEELRIKNQNVEVLGRYTKQSEKIEYKCLKCGKTYKVLPSSLLKGGSCRMCGLREGHLKLQKTQLEFESQINKSHPTLTVIGEYSGCKTNVKLFCNICNEIIYMAPNNLLAGRGCKKCATKKVHDKQRKGYEEFKKEVEIISPTVNLIGEYINCKTKMKCECKTCGKIWETIPSVLLRGSACPDCGLKLISKNKTSNHETFLRKFYNMGDSVTIIGKYKTARQKNIM